MYFAFKDKNKDLECKWEVERQNIPSCYNQP